MIYYLHTRVGQKITVIFKFFQKVLIYLSLTILSPSNKIHLYQRVPQSSKPFWNALFSIANSSCFNFSFISSIVAKRFPFIGVYSFGKSKKSVGVKSREYGRWGMIAVLFLAENSCTSIDVWAAALSWFWNTHAKNIRKNCLAWAERYAHIISNISNSDSTIIQNHFLQCYNVFIACWCARVIRTSIVIHILSAHLKPVLPQLNFCSAHGGFAKRRSQHFKWPCKLMPFFKQDLIQFFDPNSKK